MLQRGNDTQVCIPTEDRGNERTSEEFIVT
jgi:hypothetical protein